MTLPDPSPTARIILVRHGQTAHNRERRIQGHIDIPLDETGRGQAAQLARHLGAQGVRATRIHSSDLSRAYATAEALRAEIGGVHESFPALREILLGSWEGQPIDDVSLNEAALSARFWDGDPECCAPGGETPAAVGARMLAHVHAHWPGEGETLVVVSHGIAIWSLLSRLLELDYQTHWRGGTYNHRNTGYSVLEVGADRQIHESRLAQADHLAPL